MNYASESPPSDDKNRPFICPCGKSYLSYPALFTHVKQKHDGKAPGDVVRPKSQNRRGRPRKLPFPAEAGEEPQEQVGPSYNVGSNEEERELGLLVSQAESGRGRSKDFVAPINHSHIAMIMPPKAWPPQQHQRDLLGRLRDILEPLRSKHSYASSGEIEKLMELNRVYMESLEDRKSSRRPIGCELWEMELRSALLQFLEGLKDYLSREEFRNVEIIVSLLVFFYGGELEGSQEHTTANYVQHLNTFIAHFLPRIAASSGYQTLFSLQGRRAKQILLIIHEWMANQGLTDWVVEEQESRGQLAAAE